jgi:glycosyltransferase involved in cell wall biosynthesis
MTLPEGHLLARISVVTPTLHRPNEVMELIRNLAAQSLSPFELILVDGASEDPTPTYREIQKISPDSLPIAIQYIRHARGTSIQRNAGIEAAQGDFIAFIDDDIRLAVDYFERVLAVFQNDREGTIGGVAGYITNQYLDPATSARWKWYRRLKLFTTYEPGRYDYQSGYPINRYLQPPHDSTREIDFMGAGCAVWRRAVMDEGLRFSTFLSGYGILEDTHFALRARKRWKLVECGTAHCVHLHSRSGREQARVIAQKTAVNYRYVFKEIVPKRSIIQEARFWRVQLVDLIRLVLYALYRPNSEHWATALGKMEGISKAVFMKL